MPLGDAHEQTQIPIAQLQPAIHTESAVTTGIVTLIWPYTSSNKSFGILLVEPDFRLRREKGQVRITFHGSSARVAARSGIASGDHISLNLVGVEWERDGSTSKTPGKSIEWELQFRERLVLRVGENSIVTKFHIDLTKERLDYPHFKRTHNPRHRSSKSLSGARDLLSDTVPITLKLTVC